MLRCNLAEFPNVSFVAIIYCITVILYSITVYTSFSFLGFGANTSLEREFPSKALNSVPDILEQFHSQPQQLCSSQP